LGLPVVVDKPFAPTAAEAERVVAAAREKGVGLTVFQNRRWDSDFLTVRKVLGSGRLGEVFRFESRYDRWVPKVKDNWREAGDRATFTKYGLDVQEPQIKDGMHPGDPGWGVEPAEDAGRLGVNGQTETVPTEVGRYESLYLRVVDALRGDAPFPVDPAGAVAT